MPSGSMGNNADLQQRNHFLDVLKGICIIFIIITHFSWTAEERLIFLFPFWIDMAVPIFMIISGYAYSLSYTKKSINCIEKAYELGNIVNKMIRYTIPYIIAFIIEQIAFVLMGITSVSVQQIPIIGKSFLSGGIGPGSYYYPIMMQFIFMFPVIYFIIRKYQMKGVCICGCINAFYEILQGAYEMNEDCYRLLV